MKQHTKTSPARIVLAALALTALCLFALVPAASAAPSRSYQTSFGSFTPQALTVDQASGAVYAIDPNAGTVSRFSAAGAPANFTAGPSQGTNTLTGFSFNAPSAAGVAVDNSAGPANGTVYVASLAGIDIYASSGTHLTTLHGSATPAGSFSEACGVAVDQSDGKLYVADSANRIYRYTPTAKSPTEANYSGGIATDPAFHPCDLAADSGNVYAAAAGGGGALRKFAASDFAAGPPPSASSTVVDPIAKAVAVDPSTGEVYVDEGGKVAVFNSSGGSLYSFGSSADFGTTSAGVAVNGSNGAAYVSDTHSGGHQIDVFSPAAGLLPTAVTRAATTIHHTSAVLNGHVIPGSDALGASDPIVDCHFEWGTDTSYTGGTVPCNEGSSFAAAADVTGNLGFLTPATTYHFRLDVATASSGVVHGADQSFTPSVFPVIHSELGSFGPDGTAASSFTGFGTPTQLAFNQATRQLYALKASFNEPQGIYGFDASAPPAYPPLVGFSPLTFGFQDNVTIAVDSTAGPSAGNIYVARQGVSEEQRLVVDATAGSFKLTFAGETTPDLPFNATYEQIGAALAQLPSFGDGAFVYRAFGSEYFQIGFRKGLENKDVPQINVSNGATPLSGGAGASVTTSIPGRPDLIYGFDSGGAALGGNFPIDPSVNPGTPAGSSNENAGLAVDTDGNLWVANSRTGHVLEYSSAGVFERVVDTSVQMPTPDSNTNAVGARSIALDTNGDLYAGAYGPFGGTWRYSAASGYTAAVKISPSGADAIAIDPSTHHLFVALRTQSNVSEFDSAGNLLSEFAAKFNRSIYGLAVDSTNHFVYVSNSTQKIIEVYGPGVPQEVPTVTAAAPTAVSGTGATLHAQVDPETHEVTDCHFDYGTSTAYDRTAPCVPAPGGGSGDVAVSADLSLEPGNTYHFRIVAANSIGASKGPDQTLTTLGPQVREIAATEVSTTSARLSARVNPEGHSTTYHFEYGVGAYDQATPESVSLGSDSFDHAAIRALSGLSPGTTYQFRVVATSSDGVTHGPDLTFTTYASSPIFPPCPNDAFRTGAGARLPDCRAYEQASPTDKNGSDVVSDINAVQAAAAGGAITFFSNVGIPGASGAQQSPTFVARRGSSGWSTEGLQPPAGYGHRAEVAGWMEDLSQIFALASIRDNGELLTTFLSRGPAGAITTISPYTADSGPVFAGASADGSKVYFEDSRGAQLAPGATPGRDNLYLWDRDAETVSLVGVLPDSACGGSPPCSPPGGSFAGPFAWAESTASGSLETGGAAQLYTTQARHAISRDGARAFFTAGDTGQIYLRKDAGGASPSTVQVSASQASTPDPNGPKPAVFREATPSGSKAFFTSCEKLTDDSTAYSTSAYSCDTAEQGEDLYVYDTASGALTDLTVDPDGAQVRGVIGASDDGASVYFAANGVLAPGASPGDCRGTGSQRTGACSIYLSHAGAITFIARIDTDSAAQSDADNWKDDIRGSSIDTERTGRVSTNGTLLFLSDDRVTSYPNAGRAELYRYRVGDSGPVCVSCNPTGAPATGSVAVQTKTNLSPSEASEGTRGQSVVTRNLSSDGNRVFFDSPDKLVAADTDGAVDAYEWEASGSGSCRGATANGGCLYLLSAGSGAYPSFFADASASGDDVYIFTRDQLVPQDRDNLVDVYEVGVGAGLASQHASSPPDCSGDACRGSSTVLPAQPGAGTASFAGPGNPAPTARCPKGKVRKRGKCVKKHPRKAHHGRHAGRSSHSRGGAR